MVVCGLWGWFVVCVQWEEGNGWYNVFFFNILDLVWYILKFFNVEYACVGAILDLG